MDECFIWRAEQATDEQKERGSKLMSDLSGEPGKPLMCRRNEEVSR